MEKSRYKERDRIKLGKHYLIGGVIFNLIALSISCLKICTTNFKKTI